jgi:hypothetical protein
MSDNFIMWTPRAIIAIVAAVVIAIILTLKIRREK